jgi:hypothetical protein
MGAMDLLSGVLDAPRGGYHATSDTLRHIATVL